MKLDSKYFDSIRVKPEKDRLLRDTVPECDHPGCRRPGTHKAPKGRDSEGEYHRFCLDHVRAYNRGYNYFTDMPEDEIINWSQRAQTGHRPTWKLGENSWAHMNGGRFRGARQPQAGHRSGARSTWDPFGFLGADERQDASDAARLTRPVRNAELQALHRMGLDETADAAQVKAQYKVLVKRLHPDANGGSRANEDKLRDVIQAYSYLRRSGYR